MRVDIHLVSWHRPTITELAIRTIARNTTSGNYRLMVLDNGSHGDMQRMLQGLYSEGLIDHLTLEPQNIGLEAARNKLLALTQSSYFICADNDCLPQPLNGTDWIDKLIDLMETHMDYGAISCRTQVMVGTGNIFEDETKDITDFPHPGGSLRIMRTDVVKAIGGWEGKPGRGAEERYICGKLHEFGYNTGFATHVKSLHLFGVRDQHTDRWGYPGAWDPSVTGHSDVSHPALTNGDGLEEVQQYCGEELARRYFNANGSN